MCLDCGFYKGRMVVDMAAKKKARNERLQAKRDAISEQQGVAPEATPTETEKADSKEVKADKK